MNIIAMDSHKSYSQIQVARPNGDAICECRVDHSRGVITAFLSRWEAGSKVAVETIGNWYWIVDEIEEAKMTPQLVHAHKAKLMLGAVNKTDKLDAPGLNRLQRAGTLPTVWIPSSDLRDKRELPRTRMVFGRMRTQLKNRIHSVIDKYGLQDRFSDLSDMFGVVPEIKRLMTLPGVAYILAVVIWKEQDYMEPKGKGVSSTQA